MRDNTELTDLNPIVMLVVYEPINYDSVHVRMKLKNLVADAFKIDGIKNGFSINWLNSFDNQKIRYKRDVTNLIGKLKDFPPFLNDLIIRRCELIGSANKTRRENCQNLKFNPADDEDLDVDDNENPTVVTTTTRRQNRYKSKLIVDNRAKNEKIKKKGYRIKTTRFSFVCVVSL